MTSFCVTRFCNSRIPNLLNVEVINCCMFLSTESCFESRYCLINFSCFPVTWETGTGFEPTTNQFVNDSHQPFKTRFGNTLFISFWHHTAYWRRTEQSPNQAKVGNVNTRIYKLTLLVDFITQVFCLKTI